MYLVNRPVLINYHLAFEKTSVFGGEEANLSSNSLNVLENVSMTESLTAHSNCLADNGPEIGAYLTSRIVFVFS